MFSFGHGRRVRPSLKSLSFSVVFSLVTLYLTVFLGLFGGWVFVPILIAALVALGVALFRLRGVAAGLPPPRGKGSVTRIDARRTMRDGILILVGGSLLMIGLFGSVFLVSPSVFFFPVVFGLMSGLPLSVVAFFGLTAWLENKNGGRIFFVTVETTEGGKTVLVKSVELRPVRDEGLPPVRQT